MGDNIVDTIIDLFRENKWREIINKYHDHPDRNKLLWVYPSEDNLIFLKECLLELRCTRILSIGCGSGLLEWIINKATGFPVTGVEVDGAWWHCKYAPPTFIPLLVTATTLEKDIIAVLKNSHNVAILFCYFNNRPAFEAYMEYYSGSVLIIVGPGNGKAVHTDPKPFEDLGEEWQLYKWKEVRDSKDFIAIYCKNILNET